MQSNHDKTDNIQYTVSMYPGVARFLLITAFAYWEWVAQNSDIVEKFWYD